MSVYMLLIFIRVLLSWFTQGGGPGSVMGLLASVTDPYLNWFRRFRVLRAGAFDLSPIVALAVLALGNNVCLTLAQYGAIRLGILLAMAVSAIWSGVSWILGFFLVILAVRLVGYLARRPRGTGIWRVVEGISDPVLYRIKRVIFGRRIVRYGLGIAVTMGVLGAIMAVGGFCVNRLLVPLLAHLPL